MRDLVGRRIPREFHHATGPLLEREAELVQLSAAFDQARSGHGSVVAIDGPPGMGKSRLMAEAAELAGKRGFDVLTAAGREVESEFAFGVVLQLFEARVADANESERLDLLAGAATAAAPLLAPGFGQHGLRQEGDAFSVLRGLYQVCVNLGRVRPLVLLVDDVQQADLLSLRFALYLAQRLEELPLCLVVAGSLRRLKPEAQYLAELVSHPMTHVISLAPLSPEAVALEVRRASFPEASDEFCRACFVVTGGNPFLLHALAAELAVARAHDDAGDVAAVFEAGPQSVAQSVLLRLEALGSGAIPLAQAIAVLGNGVELRHAAAVAGLQPLEAAQLADELMHADVLTRGELLSFAYPIVGRAVAAAMLPAERAAAHLSAARVLDSEGASLEKVAGHLLRASRTGSDWVVRVLSGAAQRAIAEAVPEAAVRYLRRALNEPPDQGQRAKLVLMLGRAEARCALPEAVPRLRETLSVTREPGDRAVAALGISRILCAQGRSAEAADTLRKALAELDDADVLLSAQLRGTHAFCVRLGLPADNGQELSRSERDAESAETPWGRVEVADRALTRALEGQPVGDVLGLARSALDRGRLLDLETADGLGYYVATSALTICGDYQTAELALTAAIEEARGRGSAFGCAAARGFRALAIFRRGRLLDAEADAKESLGATSQTHGVAFPAVTAVLAEVLMERGQLDKAERRLALAPVPDRPGVLDLLRLAAEGRLLRKRGDFAGALACFERCAAGLAEARVENPAVVSWRTEAALAAAGMGDEDHARRLLDEELHLARSFGAPGAIGSTLHAAALLRTGERRVELLREALEYLESSQRALARARVFVELGATLRRNRKRRESQDPLRQGLDLAQRCGAPMLARRALEEIRATGSRPRRTALSGAAALTPRELQVAELAARGMSNREIAKTLYVTRKTVEWHLRNAFTKLGVGSRRELAAAVSPANEEQVEGPRPSEDAAGRPERTQET